MRNFLHYSNNLFHIIPAPKMKYCNKRIRQSAQAPPSERSYFAELRFIPEMARNNHQASRQTTIASECAM